MLIRIAADGDLFEEIPNMAFPSQPEKCCIRIPESAPPEMKLKVDSFQGMHGVDKGLRMFVKWFQGQQLWPDHPRCHSKGISWPAPLM
jgi:hypothetical protein